MLSYLEIPPPNKSSHYSRSQNMGRKQTNKIKQKHGQNIAKVFVKPNMSSLYPVFGKVFIPLWNLISQASCAICGLFVVVAVCFLSALAFQTPIECPIKLFYSLLGLLWFAVSNFSTFLMQTSSKGLCSTQSGLPHQGSHFSTRCVCSVLLPQLWEDTWQKAV